MKKINVRLEKAIEMVKGKMDLITTREEPTEEERIQYYILLEVWDEMIQIMDAE